MLVQSVQPAVDTVQVAIVHREWVSRVDAHVRDDVGAEGGQYPESTMRSPIVARMCVNAGNPFTVHYRDLYRVDRGLYRLHEHAPASEAVPPPNVTPARTRPLDREPSFPMDATAEWWWEGRVQAAVVRHLAASGWDIRRVVDTASRERGVDIEATRDGQHLLVEVKGYPCT